MAFETIVFCLQKYTAELKNRARFSLNQKRNLFLETDIGMFWKIKHRPGASLMTPLSLQLDPAPLCVTHTHAVHQIKDDNMSRNLELGFYGRGQRKDMAAIFL